MLKKDFGLLRALLICLISTACGTYYSRHLKFQKFFLEGELQAADSLLAKNKKFARGRSRLLYHMERGVTHHLLQDYEKSNQFFEEAYHIHEEFSTNSVTEVVSLLVNSTITNYAGEDHEILLIHYYKALNYVHLNNLSAALVECRRLNIALNQLSDRYNNPSKYSRDAFIHLLMGLIYQASHNYNDAFIAYRNAVEIYQTDYKNLFGFSVPLQLQKDLIYTAYKIGFNDQVSRYQKEFQLNYNPSQEPSGGDVLCLWNNGLGPVKDQWEVNFILIKGVGGAMNFVNKELGLFFPFPLTSNDEQVGFNSLHMLRVAFPKYVERPSLYQKASLVVDNQKSYPFECVENINDIAFKVLHERMVLEFSKSLLRLALKKIAEYQLRKQNEILGTILGVINFATEKADTRNWQTLPHSIYYTRLRLPEGNHILAFKPQSTRKLDKENNRISSNSVYIAGRINDSNIQSANGKKITDNQTSNFLMKVIPDQTNFYTIHTTGCATPLHLNEG